MSFFGELYLGTTLPLLHPEVTAQEVRFLSEHLSTFPPGPILDLGCGHGRHATALNGIGGRGAPWRVIGVDLDLLSLELAGRGAPWVRADLRQLPFRTASCGGAYAWYSSLFVFDDEEHLPLLQEVRRCLVRGGWLIHQSVPYERLAKNPVGSFAIELPDGGKVWEESRFDPLAGRDHGKRRWETPDGRFLSAEYAIRYYPSSELIALFQSAGFEVRWIAGGLDGQPLSEGSTDLILGATA